MPRSAEMPWPKLFILAYLIGEIHFLRLALKQHANVICIYKTQSISYYTKTWQISTYTFPSLIDREIIWVGFDLFEEKK
jgi:hypothetical protein